MRYHDEELFQRVHKARAKYVSALRIALNAAGLHEEDKKAQSIYGAQAQGVLNQLQSRTDGYDIERIIQAATALRAALDPFDSSIPRPTKEQE